MLHFIVLEQQTQVAAGIAWHLKWSWEEDWLYERDNAAARRALVVDKKPIFMLLRAGGLMPEGSTIHK